MSFRLKKIGSALCLVAFLLVGSASACICSRIQEMADSCHGSHEKSVETDEHVVESASVDFECSCFVNASLPSIVVKWDTKELKVNKGISNSDQLMLDPEFLVISTVQGLKPEYSRNFSYSTDYRAFRPARAPPRL